MNRQIVLTVYAAGLNQAYDFQIPAGMGIGTAILLIQKILVEEYKGVLFPSREKLNLIRAETGKVLNDTCSFLQAGIREGETCILA